MLEQEEKDIEKRVYAAPQIIEKKELRVELFSDEPDPWGP